MAALAKDIMNDEFHDLFAQTEKMVDEEPKTITAARITEAHYAILSCFSMASGPLTIIRVANDLEGSDFPTSPGILKVFLTQLTKKQLINELAREDGQRVTRYEITDGGFAAIEQFEEPGD